MGFSNLRVKQNNRAKMKLGFVLFAAAAANNNLKCSEKSEKKLGKMEGAFADWANDYATANKAANMITRVTNIARKCLSSTGLIMMKSAMKVLVWVKRTKISVTRIVYQVLKS